MSPSDTKNKTTIIERIKKLQAMADTERSKSPEEAATAAAMIQNLLTKHNLELREVEAHVEPDGYVKTQLDVDPGKSQTSRRQGLIEWRKTLLRNLAEVNYCQAFYHTHFLSKAELSYMSVIGQPHNLEVVTAMYQYLSLEIERLAELGWLENYMAGYTKGHGSTFSHRHKKADWMAAFKDAATQIIALRLQRQYREQQRAAEGNTTALVLVTGKELEEAAKRLFSQINYRNNDVQVPFDHDGHRQGREAGERIRLNKMVQGGDQNGRTSEPLALP